MAAEIVGVDGKWYAVKALTTAAQPHQGVYTSWTEAKPHAIGIKGVLQKAFATEEAACQFITDPRPTLPPKKRQRLIPPTADGVASANPNPWANDLSWPSPRVINALYANPLLARTVLHLHVDGSLQTWGGIGIATSRPFDGPLSRYDRTL